MFAISSSSQYHVESHGQNYGENKSALYNSVDRICALHIRFCVTHHFKIITMVHN